MKNRSFEENNCKSSQQTVRFNSLFSQNDNDAIMKKSIISAIEDKQCYIKLLKLIVKEKVKYMRSHNGIFFNVGLLSDDVLTKIDNILLIHEMKKIIY